LVLGKYVDFAFCDRLIAYTFVALEAIADELEDLFGIQPNDLALDAVCYDRKHLSEIDNKHIEPIKNLNTTISLSFIDRE
jgi:predicted membrane chloride channel (bestrophin family)